MKRATLYATINRRTGTVYTGDPDAADHAVFVHAAKIRCINECVNAGYPEPVFKYTVAEFPDPKPEYIEKTAPLPVATEGGQ